MIKRKHVILFIIISFLIGCQNAPKGVNNDFFKEGQKYVQQMYLVTEDVDSIVDLDYEGLQKFLLRPDSALSKKEQEYKKLIDDLFVQYTIYIADVKSDNNLDKETEKKFFKVLNKLHNDFGVEYEK
jgi:hypothetical protein